MFEQLWPVLVFVKQKWTALLVYKTLFLLDPVFVTRRLLWPRRPRASPRPADIVTTTTTTTTASSPTTTPTPALGLDHDTMAPVPPPGRLPRIVVYHQTHHTHDDQPISILPLITQPNIRLTHLNLAALHINQRAGDPAQIVTLNDHAPSHPRFAPLWREVRALQAAGVRVLGMLGGAARGTFGRDTLDAADAAVFERYYAPLRDVVRARCLDGLDLDVEESMSLAGVVRLIDRLRADFGADFLITLAPVAPALLDVRRNLSGFDYEALEVMRGKDIAWYNCQFYCGWGDCSNPIMYEMILMKGWPPEKVVVGLVTNPSNGSGFIPFDILGACLPLMVGQHAARFGGVMGWEYFNSLPGGRDRPWEWAQWMTRVLRAERAAAPDVVMPVGRVEADPVDEDGGGGKEAPLPGAFEYHSDAIED